MEQITFDIPSVPQMSIEDRNKLIKQAADSAWFVFVKNFIPLYFIRYWKTRYYQGAVIWSLFLTSLMWFCIYRSEATRFECYLKGRECQVARDYVSEIAGVASSMLSFVVFGVYAGFSSKQARVRLSIDRKTARAILPAISD